MIRKALVAVLLSSTVAAAAPRPLYYDREIQTADLEGRTLRELALMRNWPFARAGHPFRKKWLRDFFSGQPWYKAVAPSAEKKLSPLDSKNASIITKFETAIPKDDLKSRRDGIAGGNLGGLTKDEAAVELVLLTRALGGQTKEEAAAAPDENRSPLDDPRLLDRQLTVDQLKDLSRRDLRVLRNMVYARRGRKFKSDILQQYFDRMDWYQIDPGYSDSKLTKLDQRNVKLIRSVEDSIGGPMSDDEQKHEDGWFVQA
jgi:hypothetical protein